MVWSPLSIFRKKEVGAPSAKATAEKKTSWFLLEHFKKGLEKTRSKIGSGLKHIFSLKRGIDAKVLEEVEALLLESDMGVKPVEKVIHELKEAWKAKEIEDTSEISDFIKNRLKSDTFRAAAVDQLDIWSKRIGADIVKHQHGADPAAVTFDALEASIARGIDILIVDTAGRLHTYENLMNELGKVGRVISKKIPDAPHEVLLVLDATTGQNAIVQAKTFKRAIGVTGIFLAKLDGTAKGGVVLGMEDEVNIPVKFVGLGEKPDDIERFDPDVFVDALFD
ncbi:MAG: signal recognition particle-docking protein FtsY [Planctomycetes bacterium]|nr:signal recognition particle-docking protein FtsY [Planctomycetota bacterium]